MFENVKEHVDFETFIDIIAQIPSCIFFKDRELRYIFASHYWEQLNAGVGFDIYGKTDLEIRKDTENALLAQEADKHLIETGGSTTYTIKSEVDGHVQHLELKKNAVKNSKGEVIGIVGLINDVTEITKLQDNLKYLSSYDPVTGVRNRMSGSIIMDEIIHNSIEHNIFCILDIDLFRFFNEKYGRDAGDALLKSVAGAIKDCLDKNDVLLRAEGDQFAFLVNKGHSKEDAERLMVNIFRNIDNIFIPTAGDAKPHVSIAITLTHKRDSFDGLYVTADDALYEAKGIPGNSFCWY